LQELLDPPSLHALRVLVVGEEDATEARQASFKNFYNLLLTAANTGGALGPRAAADLVKVRLSMQMHNMLGQ
jgi:hypothetical protein